MTVYLVERDLGSISMADLGAKQRALVAASRRMEQAGTPVRYLRSMFCIADGRCFCLFEAPGAADVASLNRAAGLPYSRISEALDLMTWSAAWPPVDHAPAAALAG